jgi:hypothetical protein
MRGKTAKRIRRKAYASHPVERSVTMRPAWKVDRGEYRWIKGKDDIPVRTLVHRNPNVLKADSGRQAYQQLKKLWKATPWNKRRRLVA